MPPRLPRMRQGLLSRVYAGACRGKDVSESCMSLLQSNGQVVTAVRITCRKCHTRKLGGFFAPSRRESKWPVCMECSGKDSKARRSHVSNPGDWGEFVINPNK